LTSSSFTARKNVLSWGRVQRQPQHVAVPRFREELVHLVADDNWNSRLAIGLRRSYGNSCLNSEGALIDFCGLDRFISFDSQSGILRAEAGAKLSQILAVAVPRGWFLPTTPGTRFVTLGGAVANDVHGKNQPSRPRHPRCRDHRCPRRSRYFNIEDIEACEKTGLTPHVPKPQRGSFRGDVPLDVEKREAGVAD